MSSAMSGVEGPRWYQELGRAFGPTFPEVERAWEDHGLLQGEGGEERTGDSRMDNGRRARILAALAPS